MWSPVPLTPGPCRRLSHWLSFLRGPVEQTALKGSPAARPPAAPPAGSLQCWQERWSLPESSVLMGNQQHRRRKRLNSCMNVTTINEAVIIDKIHCFVLSHRRQCESRCWPVSVISVVFGGWVDHWTCFYTDLLEEIPHLLVDVLLQDKKTQKKINFNPSHMYCSARSTRWSRGQLRGGHHSHQNNTVKSQGNTVLLTRETILSENNSSVTAWGNVEPWI